MLDVGLAASPKSLWAGCCTRFETLRTGPIIWTLNLLGQWIEPPTSNLHLRNEMSPRSLRTLEARHCVLGHPKPNWILFCADEEIDPSSVELLSLKRSPPSPNLSRLATKVLQNCGFGRPCSWKKNSTTKWTTWVVEGAKPKLED